MFLSCADVTLSTVRSISLQQEEKMKEGSIKSRLRAIRLMIQLSVDAKFAESFWWGYYG